MTSEDIRLMEKYKLVQKPKKKQEDVVGKLYNNLKIIKLSKDSNVPVLRDFIVKCVDCGNESIKTFQSISNSKVGCFCGSLHNSKTWGIEVTHKGATKTLKQWASYLDLTSNAKIKAINRYENSKARTFDEIFTIENIRGHFKDKFRIPCTACGTKESSKWFDYGKLCLTCHTLNQKTLAIRKINEAIIVIKDREALAISKIKIREALAIDKVKARALKSMNQIKEFAN